MQPVYDSMGRLDAGASQAKKPIQKKMKRQSKRKPQEPLHLRRDGQLWYLRNWHGNLIGTFPEPPDAEDWCKANGFGYPAVML